MDAHAGAYIQKLLYLITAEYIGLADDVARIHQHGGVMFHGFQAVEGLHQRSSPADSAMVCQEQRVVVAAKRGNRIRQPG
ncbi:hypothetical protein SDC9_207975 [bioreactor metagenome]|uniref:Uncharacterized protein n=1 Tax=bioreactor metagenome TaxID=1076179 RepID=A0A645JBX2_9ZZZZ